MSLESLSAVFAASERDAAAAAGTASSCSLHCLDAAVRDCVSPFTGGAVSKVAFEFASVDGEGNGVTRGMCSLSPDGVFVASVNKTHLRVFEAASLRVRVGARLPCLLPAVVVSPPVPAAGIFQVMASHSCDKDATVRGESARVSVAWLSTVEIHGFPVQTLLWSPNSRFLCVASTVSRTVQVSCAVLMFCTVRRGHAMRRSQVFSLDDGKWCASLCEGSAGLVQSSSLRTVMHCMQLLWHAMSMCVCVDSRVLVARQPQRDYCGRLWPVRHSAQCD